MIQPVDLQDFFITFFSGAMIIIAGAAYALLFALSRVHRMPRLMPFAYLAYAFLFVSVLVLAEATHLYGFWRILVVTMLAGYLLAPHAIWHLCVGTHAALEADTNPKFPLPEDNTHTGRR